MIELLDGCKPDSDQTKKRALYVLTDPRTAVRNTPNKIINPCLVFLALITFGFSLLAFITLALYL